MRKILKKMIIPFILIVIMTISLFILKVEYEKSIRKKEEYGITIYNKVHDLYLSGEKIKYKTKNNERIFEIIDEKKYYEIENYKEIFKDTFSISFLPHVEEIFNIKHLNEKVYLKDFGRGTSKYLSTRLKYKKGSKNRLEYEAITTLCHSFKGSVCKEGKEYTITYPFTLVKEEEKWKVEEYTSVFEFSTKK